MYLFRGQPTYPSINIFYNHHVNPVFISKRTCRFDRKPLWLHMDCNLWAPTLQWQANCISQKDNCLLCANLSVSLRIGGFQLGSSQRAQPRYSHWERTTMMPARPGSTERQRWASLRVWMGMSIEQHPWDLKWEGLGNNTHRRLESPVSELNTYCPAYISL